MRHYLTDDSLEFVVMDVSRVSSALPTRSPDPPVGAASLPAEPAISPPAGLEPAVRLELSGAEPSTTPRSDSKARIAVDGQTQALLFQVVESSSGTVVLQVPDESAVKARLYAREVAARTDPEPRQTVAVA